MEGDDGYPFRPLPVPTEERRRELRDAGRQKRIQDHPVVEVLERDEVVPSMIQMLEDQGFLPMRLALAGDKQTIRRPLGSGSKA